MAALKSWNHAHADSTGSLATLFHSHPDESRPPFFKLSAPPESGLLAANPRVINLYLAAQGFPSRIPHRSAEFVKHHPRGLVTRQTELALQKQGGVRHACQWSSDTPPRSNRSVESSSGEEWSQMSAKSGADTWRIDGAVGSPIRRIFRARIEGK